MDMQATSFSGTKVTFEETQDVGNLGPGIVQYLVIQAVLMDGQNPAEVRNIEKHPNQFGTEADYTLELTGPYISPSGADLGTFVNELTTFHERMSELEDNLVTVGLRVFEVTIHGASTELRVRLPDDMVINATVDPSE
jgi:hypothetical protein